MMRSTLLSMAVLLASCTFSTDANDRKTVARLDFAMTLKDFTPHAEKQVDIVLASPTVASPTGGLLPIPGPLDQEASIAQRYAIRGRIRVLMPPASNTLTSYPDVHVGLKTFIESDWESNKTTMQVLFYADQNNDFSVEPFDATGMRLEHTWIKPLPDNGELTFAHAANFQNFFDTEEVAIGGDLMLEVPVQTASAASCLEAELAALMKESLEVRVLFNPDTDQEQQTVGFKMFAGNAVPDASIDFMGMSDSSSTYRVQQLIDGKVVAQNSASATAQGLSIPFGTWFPVAQDKVAACLAMP